MEIVAVGKYKTAADTELIHVIWLFFLRIESSGGGSKHFLMQRNKDRMICNLKN